MMCSVAKFYLTLCNSMDCSLPGSSVHGISQARILEWVAISSSREIDHAYIHIGDKKKAGKTQITQERN